MSSDHEWLNLIEVSGPFLAVPVLRDVFPQGLEALSSGRPQRLRRTYEEWRDAVDADDLDLLSLHAAWVDEVLTEALEMDGGVLRRNGSLPNRLTVAMPEHGASVSPDLAVVNATNGDEALLLIHVYDPDTDLEATRRFDGLAISPADRMVALLRGTGCSIGIVTNGERWMLVHAPIGTVAGFASWYARLWGQEPDTLRAFVSLLGVRRFFGPEAEKLPALFERSLKHQDDVTEALGEQVRRAVEVLVQALDRADQDRNRDLLRDVDPRELYEAGLTVMMRLVFLLAAEERGLLLLGDPRYDAFYAISSLRMQLRADSEEILERRRSAWSRLLALFRGVYGGIDHPTLRLPALGGSLFDPDRYPFLEGRKKGTNWRSDQADPLPIDDRTVLLLLEAIQTFESRTLSYRALDVEQIGHVYEGLLERTVKRVDDVTLELDSGAKAKSPRVTLGEVESARLDGTARVAELLKERSERSESAIRNSLERVTDDRLAARLLTVCRGDIGLRDRVQPYASLLRTDPWGYPLVHHKGAFVVMLGADRRESGTHYTPKSLTEKIVEETLTPVVYRGPSEGKAPVEWELKSAEELLDLKICDPAMGSGAFLVQACRWLSDRLVEAWSVTETNGTRIDIEGRILDCDDGIGFEPLSQNVEDRAILARRLIAERCLYGVDLNPLAVELAKLSLWLTTMSRGRPFGFLDHNLRSGDSLLGIHNLDQLTELDITPKGKTQLRLFGRAIQSSVESGMALRSRLRALPIRDIRDVDGMAALDAEARTVLEIPRLLADAFVGVLLAEVHATERRGRLHAIEVLADAAANHDEAAIRRIKTDAETDLSTSGSSGIPRRPFHWPLEFPEVFECSNPGFDAIISNPPYMGGRLISGAFGGNYLKYLLLIADSSAGQADLSAHFLRKYYAISALGAALGLITTNTISQGDTERLGLGFVCKSEGSIISSINNFVWPGPAAVHVSVFIVYKGSYSGERTLNGSTAAEINSSLEAEAENVVQHELEENKGVASKGFDLGGDGFILSSEDYKKFCSDFPEEASVLRPHLNGRELYSKVVIEADRYAINFFDWPIERASKFPNALRHIENSVKPYRDTVNRKSTREKWWIYNENRPGLCSAIRGKSRVIAKVLTSNTWAFEFLPSNYNFDQALIILALDGYREFALLQSTIHEVWARWHPSTMKSDARYTIGSCFTSFPFPTQMEALENIGQVYADLRLRIRMERNIGLTSFYNTVNDPSIVDADINDFRSTSSLMDEAVISAYGWTDIQLNHSFYESDGMRNGRFAFTISKKAKSKVLERLTELNRVRFEGAGIRAPKRRVAGSKEVRRGELI